MSINRLREPEYIKESVKYNMAENILLSQRVLHKAEVIKIQSISEQLLLFGSTYCQVIKNKYNSSQSNTDVN